MKAWIYYGNRQIKLEKIPEPEINPDEVLIKVVSCGICQTDLDEFSSGPKLFSKVPFTPGHEFCGVVEKVGDNVDKTFLGKKVFVSPLVSCGKCEYCLAGYSNLCDNFKYYGIVGLNGGMAEYVAVKAKNVVEVEEVKYAFWGEIVLVGLRVLSLIEKHRFLSEKRALVLGAGPIGACTSLILKNAGYDVEVCEIRKKRAQSLKDFGFKVHTLCEDIKTQYPVVIDCAGEDPLLPYAFPEAVSKVKKGGLFILVGVYFNNISFDPIKVLSKEIKILPCWCYTLNELSKVAEIMKKLLPFFEKMTTFVPFEKLEEAFLELEINKDKFLKIALSYGN